MELSDRKLLNKIRFHSNRGENWIVSDLISGRMQNLAHTETVDHIQRLTDSGNYSKALEELQLYRELYPNDSVLSGLEAANLLMSCVDNENES